MLQTVEDFFNGKIKNLMINIPPQHGKTDLVKSGISWNFGKRPYDRVVYTSYNYTLASKANRHIQRILDSKEYKHIFPNTTLNDRNVKTDASQNWLKNAEEFEIVGHSDSFMSAGVCGGLTGHPVDIAIIDDPIKDRLEAESIVMRNNVWDWYINVLSTRLHNNSKKLFIMTRWHEDDPAGRILKLVKSGDLNEDWTVISIPAIKINTLEVEGDPRREGEALWEEQHSLKKLLDIKRMDSYAFECLYQQNPQPKEGLLYGQFKTYEQLPEAGNIMNITDPADSGDCYTCSITYLNYQSLVYIVDMVYTQTKDSERQVAEMLVTNDVDVCEIERNAMGRLYTENVKRFVYNEFGSNRVTINTYNQRTNKDSKIFASATWINDRVVFPANWAVRWNEFHSHIINYPANGKTKYKDGADVLAEIFLRNNKNPRFVDYG